MDTHIEFLMCVFFYVSYCAYVFNSPAKKKNLNNMRKLILLLFVVTSLSSISQTSYPTGRWKAWWIAHPTDQGTQFGVFHFRKTIQLTAKPDSFIIHVSGDNVYNLFVNGQKVAHGPARSDLANWNFETINIAPFLQTGKNIITSTVWNFAEYRPYAQISYRTAFIIQGHGPAEEIINTNKNWKVIRDSAYKPLPLNRNELRTYIVVAEGEELDAKHAVWDFGSSDYKDDSWLEAGELRWHPAKTRTYGTDGNWMLVPRTIPMLEEKSIRFGAVRRSDIPIPDSFVEGKHPIVIPSFTKTTILLDQKHLTNAYPQIFTDSGQHAIIKFTYAEALYDDNRAKGNRDTIQNKKIMGVSDRFIADGKKRKYQPLYFRTYRYVQLDIETRESPLIIRDVSGVFTGYPFEEKASFETTNDTLRRIWDVGWRTARLCALDTYVDCPYYEQLQYVGDTRIQALISLYVSGDDRLMKKSIDDISHSFIPDGLTQSRYPSRDLQVIPTFSLWWVCMIYDYYMHRTDDAWIKGHLPGIQKVIEWYDARMYENGMLGKLSWWQFVDWSWPWKSDEEMGGVPPGVKEGGSSIITLQYAYTLQRAAALMRKFGKTQLADQYLNRAKQLTSATYKLCWDAAKKMFADTYEKKSYSQHANIMAVLTDAIPIAQQPLLIKKISDDKSITQATYYFTFYMFEALKKVKKGNEFLGRLEPWKDMLTKGLTTFAENPEPVRSDCHAWSASPNYQLLSIVCGINPGTAGFRMVKIEPYLGHLQSVKGKMPHPKGMISVEFEKRGPMLEGEVELPAGVSGILLWNGRSIVLKGGKQTVTL